jgi:hypothetical protein
MQDMNASLRKATLGAALLGALLVDARPAPARALVEDEAADVVFRSTDLRIYRALDRHGAKALVLTNLDEEGNLLRGTAESVISGPASSLKPGAGGSSDAAEPERSQGGAIDAASPPVRRAGVTVVVNGGSDSGAADGTRVDVRDDGESGTTVVVNINNNPPPEQPAVVPVYPAFVVGGIAGPFRYPDRQPFLGYSFDGTSPGFFGGLGLNAGNRFGLRTGNTCGKGYDCLFGPTARKP